MEALRARVGPLLRQGAIRTRGPTAFRDTTAVGNAISFLWLEAYADLSACRPIASYVAANDCTQPFFKSTPSQPTTSSPLTSSLSRVTHTRESAFGTSGYADRINVHIGGFGTQRWMSSFAKRSQRVAKKRRSPVLREEGDVVQDSDSTIVRRAEDAPPVPTPQDSFEVQTPILFHG